MKLSVLCVLIFACSSICSTTFALAFERRLCRQCADARCVLTKDYIGGVAHRGGLLRTSRHTHFHRLSAVGDENRERRENEKEINQSEEEISEDGNNKESENAISKAWLSLSNDVRSDFKTSLFTLVIALVFRFLIIEPRYIPSLSMVSYWPFPTFPLLDSLFNPP